MIEILANTDFNKTQSKAFRLDLSTFPESYSSGNAGLLQYAGIDFYFTNHNSTKALFNYGNRNVNTLLVTSTELGEKFTVNKYYYLPYTVANDSNHFFRFITNGKIYTSPSYNNQSVNFADSTWGHVYLIIEADYGGNGTAWEEVYNYKINYQSGSYLFLDNVAEFTLLNNANLRFKYENAYTGSEIVPTGFYDDWFTQVDLIRKPKTSWKTKVSIGAEGSYSFDTLRTNILYLTKSENHYLPFNGFYSVDIFVEFQEVNEMELPVNVDTAQELQIKDGENWVTIDKSPTFKATLTALGSKMVNTSLQGSYRLYINTSIENRKIWYQLNLPNGSQNKITGGYAIIEYSGDYDSVGFYDDYVEM